MSAHTHSQSEANLRPLPDRELGAIADYVMAKPAFSPLAYDTARLCLLDSLGCALLALQYPACRHHLGPIVAGTVVPKGARVPGTDYVLDPVKAAFDIGCLVRWLDFNDTFLAAEWGHPSDNLGAVLAVADFLGRHGKPVTMRDVLAAMIQAHEIQGVLSLGNSFNRVGLDHVVLVKVASTAVATHLLGGSRAQVIDALSQAFVDGQSLRTYRHSPNAGQRKSWAAGDATSRAVRLALLTMGGEPGLPSVLSVPQWGFCAVLLHGKPLALAQPFGSYVMENVLFKVTVPAEFHAQTAAEAAICLHPQVMGRLEAIDRIELTTQQSAVRIISKTGPLYNPADRDHCIQYITAIGLIFGELTANHYSDRIAADPRIDALREQMVVVEDPRYTREYLEPDKRSIANAVQVYFKDGTSTERVEVEYPLGHRRRRDEALPHMLDKARSNLGTHLPAQRVEEVIALCMDRPRLEATAVPAFMDLLVARSA